MIGDQAQERLDPLDAFRRRRYRFLEDPVAMQPVASTSEGSRVASRRSEGWRSRASALGRLDRNTGSLVDAPKTSARKALAILEPAAMGGHR
jgi:hypothetical protein